MKKTSLLSPTLGVLVCLTHSALAQTATTATPTAATPTAAAPTAAAAPSAAVAAEAPAAEAPMEPAAPTDATTPETTGPAVETPPPPISEQPASDEVLQATTTSALAAPPAPTQVPELPYMKRFLPEGNMWELGLLGGLMFPSSQHQLFDPTLGTGAQRPFGTAGELGARIAYYPLAFLGVEAEAAVMPSSVDVGTDPVSNSGGLWAVRGHLIGQYPGLSVTPFVLVGFGALGASSDAMGNDVDDAFHFGAGVKVPIDEHLSVRFDIRDTVHRQVNSTSGTGTHSPEILLGLTFVPKRRKPDHDADGFVDYADECPTLAGVGDDCPPPDADGDAVIDEKDECPAEAGIAPTGCPDQDGDGLLDKVDPCPTLSGPLPSGCPEKECPVSDTDGDGITDAADQCPAEAAPTVTGCPVKDTDGDGIADDQDKCPTDPENKDGIVDDDGCPEPPAAPTTDGKAAKAPAKPGAATKPAAATAAASAPPPAKPAP